LENLPGICLSADFDSKILHKISFDGDVYWIRKLRVLSVFKRKFGYHAGQRKERILMKLEFLMELNYSII
jgi:hypothetical protein